MIMKTSKNLIIYLGLILTLTGCHTSNNSQGVTEVFGTKETISVDETHPTSTSGNLKATSSNTPVDSPTPIPSETSTPEPFPIISPSKPLNPVIPGVNHICPESAQETSIEQIGLGPDLRLLLTRAEDYSGRGISGGLWVLSEAVPQPQLIPNTEPPPGWNNFSSVPSPEGHWIKINRYSDDYSRESSWIISLDGSEHWKLTEGDYSTIHPYWITEHEMVGAGIPNPEHLEGLNWEDYKPIYTLNPFTMEERSLDPLPEGAIFNTFFTYEGVSYAVYHFGLSPYSYWGLFNYEDKSSTPIFRWLVGRDDVYYGNTGIILGTSSGETVIFTGYVRRDYGFDLIGNLSFDEIMLPYNYEEVMIPVKLPGEPSDFAIGARIGSNSVVVISLHQEGTQEFLEHFYVLDYETMILAEYCLNDVRQPGIRVSPDQRYLKRL